MLQSNVDKYYDAYKKLDQLIGSSPARKEFKLKPGEMVIFNNRTMLHGRKAFTVSRGIRHLQVRVTLLCRHEYKIYC